MLLTTKLEGPFAEQNGRVAFVCHMFLLEVPFTCTPTKLTTVHPLQRCRRWLVAKVLGVWNA
jgi:hypothetical protein